ncbi:tetratricopeptide repeat protein [Ferruginibacter albus]|uniref:tetratricopeptide repeat protein n=1 Tax=Ferruginibacter albus TaxID=2875540 RepID=UPI001CC76EFC|nr:tetratricopeptide repeat protein [Ferruginibacter albus]UAY50838.1 tetratricopeptide repeat protein [Ferruginibacter albus]
MTDFDSCMVTSDLDNCIVTLLKNTDNEYKKYIIGGLLYDIDKDKSFQLHKETYLSKPEDLNFNLEYAIELHRNGEFEEAAKLYEKYEKEKPEDFRVNVWLADCYINIGDVEKSIENWNKSDHPNHHTSIDFAIHTIYGRTDQIKLRNDYRKEIEQGNIEAFYPLILLDMNWELDWWNSVIQEYFLAEDLLLAKNKLNQNDNDYKIIQAYVKIKNLSKSGNNSDSIKSILIQNKLIMDSNPLPTNGQLTSDLLRICFINKILSENDFYKQRGNDLLNLAKKTKDKETLNIYAYLQATVNDKVDSFIDKLGWTDFKDERFAISYFMGKADKNRYDDKELSQALADFPNSSKLYWVKANCAKIENKPLRPILIELIKREFKTLGSDENHSSYPLKSYFYYLENEK